MGFSAYELVYVNNALFPIEFEVKTLRTNLHIVLYLSEAQRNQLDQLNELDGLHQETMHQTYIIQ